MRGGWLLVGAALLAGATACSSIAKVPMGEALELATMGRERPLREPMRPIRGGTRVLILALDGVGREALDRALREGRMPRLSAFLGEASPGGRWARAYAAPDVLTVLPSSTAAAWAATFTGEPPARNGIPGNEWWVRQEGRFLAPVPISIASREHATRIYTDELLSGELRAPTLFERVDLRAHVSMNMVFRGADLLTVPNLGAFGDLVERMAGGAVQGGATTDPAVYRETDESSVRSLLGALRDHGVPDVQVAYFPGIDLLTHQAESPEETQQRYLAETTDPEIGRILDAYREGGALERTFVVVVSDHGHTAVLADDLHSLGAEGDDEPPAVLRAAGFRVRPPRLEAEGDHQAVLAYQGAMAFVYLADRSTCPAAGARCDWARPPRLEEDVLPVARAFWEASRSGAHVPALRGTLDLVLARPPRAPGEEALPFQVYDGRRLVPVRDWLRANPRPDLPRLEERLLGLGVGPHGHLAGDLLLLSRFGGERPIGERYYFGPPSRSDHGSAHALDSRVPLVVAHPRLTGRELEGIVRPILGESATQTDLVRLVSALLARP